MQLILAHSARGFQPAHNLEGLPHLRGLDNLWFDTSANCEAMAHQAIIRIIGHDKLLYGGDLPVTHARGRSVSVEDSFLWLDGDSPHWREKTPTAQAGAHRPGAPALSKVGLLVRAPQRHPGGRHLLEQRRRAFGIEVKGERGGWAPTPWKLNLERASFCSLK